MYSYSTIINRGDCYHLINQWINDLFSPPNINVCFPILILALCLTQEPAHIDTQNSLCRSLLDADAELSARPERFSCTELRRRPPSLLTVGFLSPPPSETHCRCLLRVPLTICVMTRVCVCVCMYMVLFEYNVCMCNL